MGMKGLKNQKNTRCQLNTLSAMGNKNKRLLKKMAHNSKNIFNVSLYCWNNWFIFREIITQYFADNLNTYLKDFSPKDRLTLGKFLKFRNRIKDLEIIIKNSHKSEIELAALMPETRIEQNLETEQKS